VFSPRIVIVDDDDVIRSLVETVTRQTIPSARVTSYASSLRVIGEISTGSVQLLITNCHMPDMDGPTLIRTLREQKYAIPIIMVSGSEEARGMAEAAGVDYFVPKSAVVTALPEAIRALLDT
jgi:CheY-like chemotaxis protein